MKPTPKRSRRQTRRHSIPSVFTAARRVAQMHQRGPPMMPRGHTANLAGHQTLSATLCRAVVYVELPESRRPRCASCV